MKKLIPNQWMQNCKEKYKRRSALALRFSILFCFWLMALAKPIQAQIDPHFSQYYIQPMALNPALTGAINGDYRVASVFRSQYGNALTTKGLSGEVVTNKNANFGFNLVNESSKDGSFSYTNGYLSMAYTGVRFGKSSDKYLAMGMQYGFINRRFNVSKLQFGSQWTSGLGYDPGNNSGENFVKPSVSTFDAGVGIAYYDATPNKKVNLFGGIAAFHITRPKDPFLGSGTKERLAIKYSVQAGARIIASDVVSLVPSLLYMKEGDAVEKMAGLYGQIYASENTDLIFGANWRFQDAAIPFFGFNHKGFTMGISYDVNISTMNAGAIRTNSLEVSLSYIGLGNGKVSTKAFSCPRF